MKWRRGTGAGQVEDYRGSGGRGSLGGIPMGKAGGGGLGLILVLVVLFLSGGFPGGGGSTGLPIDLPAAPAGPGAGGGAPPASDDEAQFVQFVVADVQAHVEADLRGGEPDVRADDPATLHERDSDRVRRRDLGGRPVLLPGRQARLHRPRLLPRAAGALRARGDFAQAYVIAHEFGHHVQNVLGVSTDVRQQQQEDPEGANELSIRLELQADCLAGVWGHSANQEGLLEPGDVEEGLNAAAAVGDDRIQQKSGRGVNPESWTHGSSEQRMAWFQKGFENGDPAACDTFKGEI